MNLIYHLIFFENMECTYWFKTYQINNSQDCLTNDYKLKYEDYNAQVLTRLLLGDQSGKDANDLNTNVSKIKKLIQGYKESGSATPSNGPYEIITFKQRTNNGQLNVNEDSRCIYSIILKKKKDETENKYAVLTKDNANGYFDSMWLAIFYPKQGSTCNGIACGPFHIWKVNLDGIPNVKLQWITESDIKSGGNGDPRFCIVSDFNGNGEKPIFGIIGKQNSAKFYLSNLSFYLEGRHEDVLKKYPKPIDSKTGMLDGINIYYLQKNLDQLDPQPN